MKGGNLFEDIRLSGNSLHMKQSGVGLVSVVVPLYNREDMIADTIESVIAQDTTASLEIIVIDDGSTDDSFAVVERLQEKHSNILLERRSNGGVCSARNIGFSLAKGEFIQFLDSDDLLHCTKFARQLSVLLSNAQADICTCNSVFLNEDGAETPGFELDPAFSQENFLSSVFSKNLWHLHAPLYRRQAIERIGLWNEDLKCLEDWEYSCRAAIAGCQIVHVPEALAIVRQHEGERLSHSPLRVVSQHLRSTFSGLLGRFKSEEVPRVVCDQIARHLFSAGRGLIECGDIAEGIACFREARRCAKGKPLRLRLYTFSALSQLLGHRRFLRWSRRLASITKGT